MKCCLSQLPLTCLEMATCAAEMEYSRRCAVVFTLTVLLIASEAMAQTKRLAPAYFIFGDSLSDPGNNNYLRTLSRADAPPNGIDFPNGKATGRYCNGRTATDILGKPVT